MSHAAHEAQDVCCRAVIDGSRGFVCNDEHRLANQCLRDSNSLALPSAQLMRVCVIESFAVTQTDRTPIRFAPSLVTLSECSGDGRAALRQLDPPRELLDSELPSPGK